MVKRCWEFRVVVKVTKSCDRVGMERRIRATALKQEVEGQSCWMAMQLSFKWRCWEVSDESGAWKEIRVAYISLGIDDIKEIEKGMRLYLRKCR